MSSTQNSIPPPTNGKEGCKCKDVSSTLSSLTDRSCTYTSQDGEKQQGLLLTANAGTCVPYSYGSNECLQYDMMHDMRCQVGLLLGHHIPSYCVGTWCYVDRDSCKRSNEILYRSDYFGHDEANLFYSYSTCNSTADEWLADAKGISENVLKGIDIYAGVPSLQEPNSFKTTVMGEVTTETGDEYYDDTIQYEGLFIDYLKKLKEISGGDIGNFNYTHGSVGSRRAHPTSSYTAMVQDIENGIVDMGVAPFWVTKERLKMSTFTIPLVYDKTVLAIPKPGSTYSLSYESSKVFGPFTWGMWAMILLIVFVSALLSVWFSDRDELARKRYGQSVTRIRKEKRHMKWTTYCRLALDAFLQKGIFFFSAGVEQDGGASLPHKLLMFGFAFFILIAVSAYVANLAAFLTQHRQVTTVGTIEDAITHSATICAHPALEQELISKWPDAKFIFDRSGNDWKGVIDLYEARKCSVLAFGRNDNELDMHLMGRLCSNDLVLTDSLIIETPIAFPIRSDLASGMSYWIHYAERYLDVSVKKIQENYLEQVSSGLTCVTELSRVSEEEVDEFAQISPANMILPIIVFVAFAMGATVLQLYHDYHKRKGKGTLIGRTSALDLFSSQRETNLATAGLKIFVNPFARNDSDKSSDSSIDEEKEVEATVELTRRNSDSCSLRHATPSGVLKDENFGFGVSMRKNFLSDDGRKILNQSTSKNVLPQDFPGVQLSLCKTTSDNVDDLSSESDTELRPPSLQNLLQDFPGVDLSPNEITSRDKRDDGCEKPESDDMMKNDLTRYCKTSVDLESQICSTRSSEVNIHDLPNTVDDEISDQKQISEDICSNSSDIAEKEMGKSQSNAKMLYSSGDAVMHNNEAVFSGEKIEQLVMNCHEMIEFFQGVKNMKKEQ